LYYYYWRREERELLALPYKYKQTNINPNECLVYLPLHILDPSTYISYVLYVRLSLDSVLAIGPQIHLLLDLSFGGSRFIDRVDGTLSQTHTSSIYVRHDQD
jgi:hypothetical protein